jgi:hypothetical protein
MDQRTVKLLLKAVRMLPEKEQTDVLTALLRGAMAAPPGSPLGPAEDVLFLRSGPMHGGVAPQVMEPMGPGLAMLPVRLSPELHERLRTWSSANGFSMAGVVRGLVERFLDEQARETGTARPGARGRKTARSTRRRTTGSKG